MVNAVKVVKVVRVEGNIGAGKSTVLKHLEGAGYDVVAEPVHLWTHHLTGLYASADTQAWSLPMQSLAMCTRTEMLVAGLKRTKGQHGHNGQNGQNGCHARVVCVERSSKSAHIFARATLQGRDTDAFQRLSDRYDDAVANAFEETSAREAATIYLRADPTTCGQRVAARSRTSESGLSPEYLKRIHDEHEAMFADADLIVNCDNMSASRVADEALVFLRSLA